MSYGSRAYGTTPHGGSREAAPSGGDTTYGLGGYGSGVYGVGPSDQTITGTQATETDTANAGGVIAEPAGELVPNGWAQVDATGWLDDSDSTLTRVEPPPDSPPYPSGVQFQGATAPGAVLGGYYEPVMVGTTGIIHAEVWATVESVGAEATVSLSLIDSASGSSGYTVGASWEVVLDVSDGWTRIRVDLPAMVGYPYLLLRYDVANPTGGTLSDSFLYMTGYSAYETASVEWIGGGRAYETDTARAGSMRSGYIDIVGTQATETSTVFAGVALAGALILGGQAVETDEARAGVARRGEIIAGTQAVETSTANAGSIGVGIVGGRALETDEAFAGSFVQPGVILGGQAVETDTANTGTIVLGYVEADTSNRVGGRVRSGYGVATWNPAVVAVPAGVSLGEAHDVANAFSTVTMDGTQPVYTVTTASTPRHRNRIVVGGKDVTFFRDVVTPLPSYQLVEPLLYGPARLTFPQIAAAFERFGVGELKWLRKGKRVLVQRVDETGTVVATDYRGVVVAFDTSGSDLTVEVGGEASGRAALMNRQVPIFRSVHDIGRYAFRAIRDLGLPFEPRLGPTTGIELGRFGGTSQLDYIHQLVARAWTRGGNQWTIMPDAYGVYGMARKDTTTVHGTIYLDDSRTVGNLRRDAAEEPNRVYATAVNPDGQRLRFGVYPGLAQGDAAPYPMADDSNFGLGTTDFDTDTGDGITVMIGRLQVFGYLSRREQPGGYDEDVEDAIAALQDDAGLTETGIMTPKTWRALYDLDATGFSLRWSHIEPAAQRSSVRRWRRTASGAIIGRNPGHDPGTLKVDLNVDMGTGFERGQVKEWARAELARGEDNWIGTAVLHTGGLVAGEHTPGTTITDVMSARDLRPGMNLSAPLFQGGVLLHVSAVQVEADGTVTATLDTQARDTMKAWQIIERNRESRHDPARAWMRDHRSSTITKDSLDIWDEVGGKLGDEITLTADQWRVFQVVAGQEGTVSRFRLTTSPDAEFVAAVFGHRITADRLARVIGNPLTEAGSERFADEDVRDRLDEDVLLYVAGDETNPLGYWPKTKEGGGALTGRWQDDAGFGYRTFAHPVLYVAVYADRDTTIPAGRIMWPQLESGS